MNGRTAESSWRSGSYNVVKRLPSSYGTTVCWQQLATGPYLRPAEWSYHPHISLFFYGHFTTIQNCM